jgi:hypothetical protein
MLPSYAWTTQWLMEFFVKGVEWKKLEIKYETFLNNMKSPKLNKHAALHFNSFPFSYSKPRIKSFFSEEKFLDKFCEVSKGEVAE